MKFLTNKIFCFFYVVLSYFKDTLKIICRIDRNEAVHATNVFFYYYVFAELKTNQTVQHVHRFQQLFQQQETVPTASLDDKAPLVRQRRRVICRRVWGGECLSNSTNGPCRAWPLDPTNTNTPQTDVDTRGIIAVVSPSWILLEPIWQLWDSTTRVCAKITKLVANIS